MTKLISAGKKHRELVEVEVVKGKKSSITFHQTLIGGEWVNNSNIKSLASKWTAKGQQ